MVKKSNSQDKSTVRYRDFWGVTKREDLLRSLEVERFDETYDIVNPEKQTHYSFQSGQIPTHYRSWPTVSELYKLWI